MDSQTSNGTWALMNLPYGGHFIGCKWIINRKLKPYGTLKKFKARLVAKRVAQKENIDFFVTFSHFTRVTYITMLLAISVVHNFLIHQTNIKIAFLNREIEEDFTRIGL